MSYPARICDSSQEPTAGLSRQLHGPRYCTSHHRGQGSWRGVAFDARFCGCFEMVLAWLVLAGMVVLRSQAQPRGRQQASC